MKKFQSIATLPKKTSPALALGVTQKHQTIYPALKPSRALRNRSRKYAKRLMRHPDLPSPTHNSFDGDFRWGAVRISASAQPRATHPIRLSSPPSLSARADPSRRRIMRRKEGRHPRSARTRSHARPFCRPAQVTLVARQCVHRSRRERRVCRRLPPPLCVC